MAIKRNKYTKNDATDLYIKLYRNKILEELKVLEIQKRIKNKLLNITEPKESVDLLFYKNQISGFNLSQMSRFLSDDIEHSTTSANDDELEDSNGEIQHTSEGDLHKSNKRHTSEGDLHKSIKKSKYIEIEAECSDAESKQDEDEEDINYEDMSFIDDGIQNEEENNLFYEEKENEDKLILKSLQSKFRKKTTRQNTFNIVIEESEDAEELSNCVKYDVDEISFEKVKHENIKEEKNQFVDFNVSFQNLSNVEKMHKKKDTFIFQKKDNV